MLPSGSFMLCLHSLPRYVTAEFQASQVLVPAAFGGLTTALLYVGPLFGNLVLNDSRFVSLT